MEQEKNVNLEFWDSVVSTHMESNYYDLDGFLNGESALDSVELDVVGDVSGKKLLHLQCHFGLGTFSWERKGAIATGLDFSPVAIKSAKELANKYSYLSDFVLSNVYDLSTNVDRTFDIVFTSYGVLCWLDDLEEWARQIYLSLRQGGSFHIVEYHPLLTALTKSNSGEIIIHNQYFNEGVEVINVQGSYASGEQVKNLKTYEWAHSLGEILQALIDAGLTIISFKEYEHARDAGFVGYLEQSTNRKWKIPNQKWKVPLSFSISAVK